MAKQLNVNLAFNADTGKAKAQIQDLQHTLNNLVKTSAASNVNAGKTLTKDLMEAQVAASKLQTVLNQSMNMKTGNLDLTKFSEGLNKAGLKIEDLGRKLDKLGPEGQKAFMSLTQSIVAADVPLRRTNHLVSEMWTTMKNAARWQLSSSVLHGFMGSLQQAMGYARDLDQSLNDIRIVTNASADEMAAFADRANKAAKALSATTTQYTKASLIYYQQGLSDQEVQDRADITIKMAHASGQSAEIVSDQLTAVWNNFAKGGENLEYYADVMTALGAATASSSDEIAGGLEKFASIADMIGLSYEYAASALATITATTRQSEDVVGTALKTIFARIQGLKLGETLDDGTDLNKYSEALQKVGISIFEQNGELKDMDNILSEMGAKWETLSKDQQVALAQTVAGVRQYNQLVSLMDGWDFMLENLELSRNSEGTLQEQADIYAESWQAARDRVKAAAQDIYDSILDPDFFITFLDLLEDVLSGVANLTDALGGLPGVLSLLGVIGTKVFSEQLAGAVERTAFNIKSLMGITQSESEKLQKKALSIATNIQFNTGTSAGDMEASILQKRLKLQEEIREASIGLTQESQEQLNNLLQINDAYAEQAIRVAREKDQASDAASSAQQDLRKELRRQGASEDDLKKLAMASKEIQEFQQKGLAANQFLQDLSTSFTEANAKTNDFNKGARNLETALRAIGLKTTAKEVKELRLALKEGSITFEEYKQKVNELITSEDLSSDFGYQAQAQSEALEQLKKDFEISDELAENYSNTLFRLGDHTLREARANGTLNEQYLRTQRAIHNFKDSINQLGKSVVQASQGISSIAVGLSSLKSAFDTLNNSDLSTGEKALQITTSLAMAIPSLAMGYDMLKKSEIGEIAIKAIKNGIDLLNLKLTDLNTLATTRQGAASGFLTKMLWGQVKAMTAAATAGQGLLGTLGPIALGIAAVIAVVYLLVKAFEAIKNASPEAKLNRLKEETEKAKTSFNDLTSSINETKTALDGLESSYEKIRSLKEGTAEWREEIAKTNTQIYELIDQFPELAKGLEIDENGLLYLNEDTVKAFEKQQEKKAIIASNVYAGAQIREQEEEIKQTKYKNMERTGLDVLPAGMSVNDVYDKMIERSGDLEYGQDIFTRAGAYDFGKEIYGDNFTDAIGEQILAMAEANENNIKEINTKQRSLDTLQSSKFDSQLNFIGTNRTQEEALQIAGYESYEDFEEKSNQEYKDSFGDWINNGKFFDSKQQAEIEKFMELKNLGPDAKYVGQSGGKIRIESGDEELTFTEEEFYNTMGEANSVDNLQKAIVGGIKTNLKEKLSFENKGVLDELSDESLINLDNLQNGIFSQVFGNIKDEELRQEQSDQAFSTIASAYSGEDKKLSTEETEQLTEDTQFIEWNTENTNKFKETIQAYDEGKIKIEEVTSALREMNAAGQMEGMGDTFAEAASQYGMDESAGQEMHEYAQHLMEVADESEILDDSLDENAEAAAAVSISVSRMNKGIETLAENFEDWNSVLKKSDKASAEYSKAMNGTKQALSDVLGVEKEMISSKFVENHLDEIAKAATGDEKAIQALKAALAEDILLTVTGETDFSNVDQDIQDLHNQLLEFDTNIKVGAELETGDFHTAAQGIIDAASMTVDQAQAYFNSLGYEPEFVMQNEKRTAPMYGKKVYTDDPVIDYVETGNGSQYPYIKEMTTHEEQVYMGEQEQNFVVPALSGDGKTPQIKSLTKINKASMNNYSSSNKGGKPAGGKSGGGGGKSKGKPPKKVKDSDVLDRYKEITDQLDDVTDAYDDASRAADRLYGAARIKEMDKQIALLDKEVALLEKKKEKALEYLKIDKAALDKAAKDAGVSFIYDEKLNIVNYEEQLLPLYTQLNNLIEAAGAEVDEAEQEQIDKLQEKITALKEAITQYDTTKEEYEETEQTQQEKKDEKQDLFYEKLDYKLELKLEIEETSLKKLDYLMNKWSDDFFKSAETAALMYDPKEYDQSDGYRNNLKTYGAQEDELKKQYEAGQISQAKYIEGLKKVQDGYYENLEALVELDKQMLHFYEDTLAAGAEELADYTDHMEHLTGIFDHYLNLMDILGKTKDYEAMGDFLGGRADTLRDRLDVAKEYYDVMLNQKADVEQELNNAIRSGDEESVKFWQEQWDAIVDATDEAQEQVLSLTEEWAEAMKATIDNNMAKIKDTLEKSLTDGMGFDFLMAEFDRLNTRQEEYLTKTNQIYETNKLIRQASQKIDETDNKVAKQKMQNFVAETKALQENNQLSNYELEIQQAKYDLLLAEIALEEAQNAKSTVRMQRDSEGNFGYVYTADQDAVNDAQQGVEDAENRLYNLSLEGQQEYTEKYLQAQQEMTEALAEQWSLYYEEGAISLEEYNQRCDQIYEHYLGEGGVFQTYSKLYNVAVQTDAAATADYWGKQYGDMTQRTEEWQVAVNDYMIDVEEQTEEWAKVSEQANKDVEGALKDGSKATKELTQESDKLGKKLRNEVIPDLEDEYDQVMENVKAYEAERDAIQEVIDTYEKRAIQLGKDIVSESEKALDDEDETTTSDSKKFRDDYAADIRDLVLNKNFDIKSDVVQSLLAERQEKINSDEKWTGMSNDELIKNIEADKKKKKVTSMDTGGFTGIWGPEGKLAFLHQKELVLNEHDTDNMLNTVSMIRELVNMIDGGAAGSMISGLLSTPGFTNMLNHDFQQHVEIYAEFPSATDHTEIEQAFNNLLNTASQYANRK